MIKRTFPIVLAMFSLVACAAETSSDVSDEGTTDATASDLTGKAKHHYEPSVQSVDWHPGCGMVRVDQPPCPQGLTMTFTKSYIDLQVTHTERVNNKTHTLEITLDTWSYSTIHPMVMVMPQTIQLSPQNLQMSQHYTVHVRDRKNVVLWEGEIATYLAM